MLLRTIGYGKEPGLMKNSAVSLFVLLILPNAVAGQIQSPAGNPFIRNYSPKEYKAHEQVWSIVQDHRGLMYFGNSDGILEYDGSAWRLIESTRETPVRSMDVTTDGRVYVGGVADFGYLEPDSVGSLHFKSLVRFLPDSLKTFSDVWVTRATSHGVFFMTYELIFVWNGRAVATYQPPASEFNWLFAIDDTVYVELWQEGLTRFDDGKFRMLDLGPLNQPKYQGVDVMLPYDSNRILTGSRYAGLFLYDKKEFKPFPNQIDHRFLESNLYAAIGMPDGQFAFSTLRNGALVIDSHGRLQIELNLATGLINDMIWATAVDNQGGIWLGTDKGISRVEFPSPLSMFDERLGLKGTVSDIVRTNSAVAVATSLGLYLMDAVPGQAEFKPVEGIETQCWSLLPYASGMLVGAANGAYDFRGGVVSALTDDNTFRLLASEKNPGKVFAGLYDGLGVFQLENGRWTYDRPISSINAQVMELAESADGTLWLSTAYQGILKIDWETPKPVVTRLDTAQGLPGMNWNRVCRIGDDILCATEKGLYRFNETTRRFEPDSYYSVPLGKARGKRVARLIVGRLDQIWYQMPEEVFYAAPNESGVLEPQKQAFHRLSEFSIQCIFPDVGGVTWVGGADGLLRYDPRVTKSYDLDVGTVMRSVMVRDSLIFGGYQSPANPPREHRLRYIDNALRFVFAVSSFDGEALNRFQYKLEGFEDHWSSWRAENNAVYTNIPEGKYRFVVRAKNAYEKIARPATFDFEVLPPWFRAWWAYLVYLALFLGAVLGFVGWRSSRLVREKQMLEEIVTERTGQLEIQARKLQEMDHVKSRFFANISHEFRTPLTLILGPLKKMLDVAGSASERYTISTMIRNGRRLLRLINQLLDLSSLESGAMTLEARKTAFAPFVRGIVQSFSSLAERKKIVLELNDPDSSLELYVDEDRMEKVLFNLLSNAFKFTPREGSVAVSVAEGPANERFPDGFAEITIKDTGIGIPNDRLDSIFDRFSQVDFSHTRQHEGSGIGLALSKELVELHHGEIEVDSELGKGSTFTVRLQKGTQHLRPEEIVEAAEPQEQDLGSLTGSTASELELSALTDEALAGGETGLDALELADGVPTVLVVEDNADVRAYIRESLSKSYHVAEALDGADGLTKAAEIMPDLILSDVMMPGMDGYALTERLKSQPLTSHIPVIMLTAKASERDKIEGLETGADDYLVKPFNSEELLVRIKNLIALRKTLREKFSKDILLDPQEVAATPMDQQFLEKAIGVIQKSIMDPQFGVEKLSDELGLSRSQVHRKITSLVNQTPTHFIRSVRLKKAYTLLKKKSGTVSQIAFDVGFNNLSYFSRCFKEQFGILPSELETS